MSLQSIEADDLGWASAELNNRNMKSKTSGVSDTTEGAFKTLMLAIKRILSKPC